jgi:tRNA threonylcarbamoyladenosine biosynthesis protein TsaE
VKSPTYTLIETYALAPLAVSHWDLYRLGSADEMDALGAREAERNQELMLVEWPERAGDRLAGRDLDIHLVYDGLARRATLRALTTLGHEWLGRLPMLAAKPAGAS